MLRPLTPFEIFERNRLDFPGFAEDCLKIRTKDGAIQPLILNRAQRHVHERIEEQKLRLGKVRALGLKGRQQGFSTYITGRYTAKVTSEFGKRAYILTHEQKATNNLFDMVSRYYEMLPLPLKPHAGKSSATELFFDRMDSGFLVGTAGAKATGRGGTYQFFHGSEVAYWDDAETHMAGIGQAVPDLPGTEIVLESTAYGVGNLFHTKWQHAVSGEGEYIAIFVPWFWQEEYVKEPPPGYELDAEEAKYAEAHGLDLARMFWRRCKIFDDFSGEVAQFNQEYPACVTGETRVGTNLGLIPIREARAALQATRGRIVKSHPQPPSKIFKLTTALGYSVRGTWDHPIFTEGGVLAPLISCEGLRVQLCQPKAADDYHTERWIDCGVNCSVTFDEKWGRLLGLFMGDGSLGYDTLSIVCDARDDDLILDVRHLLHGVLGADSTVRMVGSKKGGAEVRAHGRKITQLFDRLDLVRRNGSGNTRRRVHVPEIIWRSPLPVIREFLRGLFEADGFNGYKQARVSLFSKHPDFLADIQVLLLAFGITSRRTSRPAHNKTHSYTANTIDLRAEESRAFCERIGFLSQRKNRVIPAFARGRHPAEITLADEVVSVEEDGFEETFDLTVEGGEAFDANGILTHNTPEDAFMSAGPDTLIMPLDIALARRAEVAIDPDAAVLMGVDVAEYGDDKSAIAVRKGRVALPIKRFVKKGLMEFTGIVANEIHAQKPQYVMVDSVGLGAGVADRLMELGFRNVIRVHSGENAIEDARFVNKRAEMWWEMSQWIKDRPIKLPDSDELQAELSGPTYGFDSSRRIRLESKELMKKRGLKSPDGGDALALTFAYKVASVKRRPLRRHTNWRTM